MKKILLALLLTLTGCAGYDGPGPLFSSREDTRLPRYCYIKADQTLSCHRTLHLCNEAEFEERYIEGVMARRHCRFFRVERNLLPYWDQ
jgi:hypothetical protein